MLSRNYAERAKTLFEELDDERTVGRLLNNLGGLSLLLGKPHEAIEQLKASFAVAVEVDSQADAGQAVNGLATVHLRLGDWEAAEEHAREALRLLDGREDFLDEIGQAQVVLGRSLLERERFDEAEQSLPRRRCDLRAALVDQPPRRGVGGPGRPCRAARRGRGSSTAVPECGRGASGPAVLETERRRQMKTRLLFFALTASVLFASWGAAARPFPQLVGRQLGTWRLARLAACASPRLSL